MAAMISRFSGHLADRQVQGGGTSAAAVRGRAKAWCRGTVMGGGGAFRPGTHGNMARLNAPVAQARRVRGPIDAARKAHTRAHLFGHSVGSELGESANAGRVGLALEL